MKLLHEQVMGAVAISGLVAIGLFSAGESDLPRWARGEFLSLWNSRPLSEVTVSDVEWSADGNSLLLQSRGVRNALSSLVVYDFTTGASKTPAWADSIGGGICHSSYSPDGTSVVVATFSGEMWWIDIETAAATELGRGGSPVACTAFSSVGRLIAGGAEDGSVVLCDPSRGETAILTSLRRSPVKRLRFSEDAHRVLCTRADGSISVWETATRKLIDEINCRETQNIFAAFLPGTSQILASCGMNTIQILDVELGSRVWQGGRGTFGTFGISTLDVAPAGNLAAWGDALNHRIVVWDLQSRQKRFEIENPSVVTQIRFSPDGRTLAVAGRENIIRIYDLRNGLELQKIEVDSAA